MLWCWGNGNDRKGSTKSKDHLCDHHAFNTVKGKGKLNKKINKQEISETDTERFSTTDTLFRILFAIYLIQKDNPFSEENIIIIIKERKMTTRFQYLIGCVKRKYPYW